MNNELVTLKSAQISFVEWLATPIIERQPKTQKELALQLGVSEATLCNWKQNPEVWDYRDKLLRQAGKDKVPDAIKKIGDLMECGNKKVELEAGKDILSRWSDPRRSAHIVTTLKELYQLYDKDSAT